jgi:hypothetical protein
VPNLRGFLAKLFGSDNTRPSRPLGRGRPRLEALEDRLAPAVQNFWIGPTTNALWSNPANWSRGQVPGADDIVTLTGRPGGSNTASVDDIPTLSLTALASDSSYTGTLTLAQGASLTVSSSFLHYGGLVLEGSNTIAAPNQGINEYGTVLVLGTSNTFAVQSYILNQQASLAVSGEGLISYSLTITGNVLQQGSLTVGDLSGSFGAVSISGGSYSLQGVTTLLGSRLDYTGATQLMLGGTLNLSPNPANPFAGGSVVSSSQAIGLSGTLTTSGFNEIDSSVNNAGTLQFAGDQTTFLTITGSYSQLGEGTLNMRVGAMLGSSDALMVGGTANLGGTLNVSVLGPGNVPGQSNWGLIMAWGGVSGGFDAMSFPPPPPDSNGWSVSTPSPGSTFYLWD